MLCSIEYQYTRNKSLAEIEGILPDDYKMEIRNHIYKDFLRLDPAALWTSAHALRQSVSLRIAEVSAETAEQLFDYPSVGRCDLLFLKKGAAQSCLEIDHAQRFPRRIEVLQSRLRRAPFSTSSPSSAACRSRPPPPS